MARLTTMLLCLTTLTACASNSQQPEPEGPLLRETTLTRFDGTAISLEELLAIRASAVACADTVARLERSLLEPGAEQRSGDQLMRELTSLYPSECRLARTLWESAEPRGPGNSRQDFREFGWYSNQLDPLAFGPRVRPETLEDYAELLLRGHDNQLLAAWRRFAPGTATRMEGYLAASWRFELDYVQPVEVTLSESLIGPHLRCDVGESGGISFHGPPESYDGYSAPALLLDLLIPGPSSPVAPAIEALARLAGGETAALPFRLANGRVEPADELDQRFLRAALNGLRLGHAELESLPAGVQRVAVVFSYLVEQGEARASLSFRRSGAGWELELFDYQPAAASLLGGDARLDLLPAIRGLINNGRRE